MKAYSMVKYEGLKNPTKSQKDLQNADLSRPTEAQREENMNRTKQELHQITAKKSDPKSVSNYISTHFPN
jgi:hypothetical protein